MSQGRVSPDLLAALHEWSTRVPPESIDQVWLFPPRPVGEAESSLAVLSLFANQDPAGRRRIVTLHCTATTQRGRVRRVDQLAEQGTAPHDRLERVIDGVVHRLRSEAEMPSSVDIRGDAGRWCALLDGIASVA
jgi:hypothetical protein